jgi:2-pyrone-4,6-dicarboxylate lactonase
LTEVSGVGAAPTCLPPARVHTPPQHRLPAGATDCHCHVFDDPLRYPLIAQRSYTPAPAPLADYLTMCEAVGLERTVQVNASVYGSDNRITLDTIAALGQHRARGVAGLAMDATAKEIERLHLGGMRGVRVSTHVAGYGGTEHLETTARQLKPFGWHLQLHVAHSAELATLEQRLLKIDAPLVFDHLGCVHGQEGVSSSGFQTLLRVLRQRDDCWVKISSWYRRSIDPLHYADIRSMAQALVEARPDRVVFGSNWPHPHLFAPATVPQDAQLIDHFYEWIPSPEHRQAILVHNPERLYGFPPVAALNEQRQTT